MSCIDVCQTGFVLGDGERPLLQGLALIFLTARCEGTSCHRASQSTASSGKV